MNKNERHTITICLVAILFVLSFFKDDYSPDYLNTANAAFLGETEHRFNTLLKFPLFWIFAFGYSTFFFLLPFYIIKTATLTIQYARGIMFTLIAVCIIQYIFIFANNDFLDMRIIPKINRFYHSPIATLFFLAAFNINTKFTSDA